MDQEFHARYVLAFIVKSCTLFAVHIRKNIQKSRSIIAIMLQKKFNNYFSAIESMIHTDIISQASRHKTFIAGERW